MARRTKTSRRSRSGDPRKRAAEERGAERHETGAELAEAVAEALGADHPVDVLMLASSLLAGLDPRRTSPDEQQGLPPADEFVRMFFDSDDEPLRVFAWVVAQLLADPGLQAEAEAALEPSSVPGWLPSIAAAEAESAWQTTDPLRDSTDIVLSLRLGDHALSLIALVDFNTEGAIKDAFAVPAPLTAVQAALGASGQTGMTTRDLDLADARAWLIGATTAGLTVEPPFETDTWPQIQPLLEWALRRCPGGGSGWKRRVWTRTEIGALVDEFGASPLGEVAVDPTDRTVLVEALELLDRETYGDPLLISATKVEMGLGHVWPTALDHDLDRLLALPDVLGPYIRWAHARQGVPTDDTDEALAALAHRRAEYSRDVAAANADGGDGAAAAVDTDA